ncbi:CDP-alcohol phosphatidyltransferase family protein [Xinfangfangia sp. CPCC 101601]|uniref:CDP-alcohol phosphatidyltransferase family protein n=1 Tax=Pseudogemmobacter lacusdianii TaxID=3069608 RepID=A0ABU0W121_9RHOB|nr:CDP-alcohol phosphatidyltransferase family protein [Xinfangfangia sp. CPCC 101601]MDQ2067686.1 CDP-alcohol phosphatidyltransferase family protein [Xinfangfangia sp. CPCC 101601]
MAAPNRRPLASRNAAWAQALSRKLVASRITPNQISAASVGFALLGFLAFWAASCSQGLTQSAALILAGVTIQARLICNLLDGMVAIEGGKSSPTGPFWNEAPDRAADLLFLAGAGLAAHTPALGLTAAALAIATAYLRELGRAEGFPPDFSGPMAKPQRMAALTLGTVISALYAPHWVLQMTLWIITIGAAATIARRALHLLKALNTK